MHYSVKDKDNLASVNQWSGGDYNNNTAGLSGTLTAEVSSDYSTNGDKSFKITSSGSDYAYCGLFTSSSQFSNGDSVTGSIKILNNSGSSVTLRLLQIEGNAYQNVTVPSSDTIQTVSVSHTLTADSSVSLRIVSYALITVYVDDICFIKN